VTALSAAVCVRAHARGVCGMQLANRFEGAVEGAAGPLDSNGRYHLLTQREVMFAMMMSGCVQPHLVVFFNCACAANDNHPHSRMITRRVQD
jgi:hypothetical protein